MKLEDLEVIKNAWLEQFPKDRRSTIINWMIYNDIPTLKRKMKWYDGENLSYLETIVRDMEEIPGTLALIKQFYVLNKVERLKPKVPLIEQPPTDKQLAYLKVLGCVEVPGNKKRAIELISERTSK